MKQYIKNKIQNIKDEIQTIRYRIELKNIQQEFQIDIKKMDSPKSFSFDWSGFAVVVCLALAAVIIVTLPSCGGSPEFLDMLEMLCVRAVAASPCGGSP